MSAATDNQVNFNPAWMQTPAARVDKGSLNRGSDIDDPSKTDVCAPVFASHRYGREDVLAMMPKITRPPDGLRQCPFFVEESQPPIILSSLNEHELRLQQNINSSKALSLLTHNERVAIQAAGNGGSGTNSSSPWMTVGGAGRNAKPASRWSALTTSDTPGGSGYVKAGMSRGGGTASSGRGGGTAGSTIRGRGGSTAGANSFTTSSRSRLRSTDTSPPAKAEHLQHLQHFSSGENEFSRQTSLGGTLDPPKTTHPEKSEHHPLPHLASTLDGEFSRQLSLSANLNTAKHIPETNMNDHDPIQQILKSIQSSSPPLEVDLWYYLAPTGDQHGPYEAPQMLIWYKSGFFRDDLRCRRSNDQHFTTLGELIQKNGRESPFVALSPEPVIPSVPMPPENAWRNPAPDYFESQRAIMEEKRKLEERQEALRREEQERLERERRVREMEYEIQRKQEELQKIALAKEEELERKRRQLAEYEARQRQEAERRLVEARAKEQMEARRMQEQLDRDRQELEEKQRKAEEILRLKQEEVIRAREQAVIEARRAAEEEHRRQLQYVEEQEQIRKAEVLRKQQEERRVAEELQRQEENRLRAEHQKLLLEAQRRRKQMEAEEEAAAKNAARLTSAATKAPWTASAAKDKPHQLQTQRSLLEIQLEEEKALEEKRRKELELLEIQRKQAAASGNIKPSGPWSGTTITSTVVPKTVWNSETAVRSPARNTVIINNTAWPAMPSPPPKHQNQPPKLPQPQKPKVEQKKDDSLAQFQKWAIKAIKDLNKTVASEVDPEMFFGFIDGVIDPVDVEDYFVSYFGDNDAVKEFQKKFLEKRIALRSKQKKNDKDDLSAAQAAVNAHSLAGGKKKKKGKGQVKSVDLNVLGFKATGDPNRINAGEIDTAPPVSMKKKR